MICLHLKIPDNFVRIIITIIIYSLSLIISRFNLIS